MIIKSKGEGKEENNDGSTRNPKYIIDISRMMTTERGYLFTRNFNYDLDDYEEDFPEE